MNLTQKIDPIVIDNLAAAVILFYLMTASCWFYIYNINIKFKTAYPVACLGMGFLWMYYGYRSYHFFFINHNIVDEEAMWENICGVIALFVLSFVMCMASKKILNQIK